MLTKDLCHGFRLKKKESIAELDGEALLFQHEQSGANLVAVLNDDIENTFSIAFKTPSSDDRGLPHIVEHCVLRGSRKFSCKRPLYEILKGSLYSGMMIPTTIDKTTYAVTTKNPKDYINIIDYFLDSVFYPNFLSTPEIFMDQAWRFDVESTDGKLKYNGSVYNEQRGAFSNKIETTITAIYKALYPDNCYSNHSFGIPDYITEATWEDACLFHRKYYQPSNCYIFMHGGFNLGETLGFIHRKYLVDFSTLGESSSIQIQKPFAQRKEVTAKFPVADDSDLSRKTVIALGLVCGKTTDIQTYLGLNVLNRVLLGSANSPLKKALLESDLGNEVIGSLSDMYQPCFLVVLNNSEKRHLQEFAKIIKTVLEILVDSGIPKRIVDTALNAEEFKMREASYLSNTPLGIRLYFRMMSSWQYGGDPFAYLKYAEAFKALREKINDGFLEELISTQILDNSHAVLLTVEPERGLQTQRDQEIESKLKAYKESLNALEIRELIDKRKSLSKYLSTEDSPEDLATIPSLSKSDISSSALLNQIIETETAGMKVLISPRITSGISYLVIHRDSSSIPVKDIQYLALICDLIGSVGTRRKCWSDMISDIESYTGGIQYTSRIVAERHDPSKVKVGLTAAGKCLNSCFEKMTHLISEMNHEPDFSNYDRVLQQIMHVKSRLENSLVHHGNVIVKKRLFSQLSHRGFYEEQMTGLSYYHFLSRLEIDFRSKPETVVRKLKSVLKKAISGSEQVCGMICEETQLKANLDLVKHVKPMSAVSHDYNSDSLKLNPKSEMITAATQVQYVGFGCNLCSLGYGYTDELEVLRKILNLQYFPGSVIKEGAYGANAYIREDGNMGFISFRDPNFEQTFENYRRIPDYLTTFSPGTKEMDKYIISTVREIDAYKDPIPACYEMIDNYIRKVSFSDQLSRREKILTTEAGFIRSQADVIDAVLKNGRCCSLGDHTKLDWKRYHSCLIPLLE